MTYDHHTQPNHLRSAMCEVPGCIDLGNGRSEPNLLAPATINLRDQRIYVGFTNAEMARIDELVRVTRIEKGIKLTRSSLVRAALFYYLDKVAQTGDT